MARATKTRASKQEYRSPMVRTLPGLESPFDQNLDMNNRWILMSQVTPWDKLVSLYRKNMRNSEAGADGINPRVAIGAMIIKHFLNISDRETVLQIQENMYMQYFIGYSSFSNEIPFDASLFVNFRKRLSLSDINQVNAMLVKTTIPPTDQEKKSTNQEIKSEEDKLPPPPPTHQGKIIVDATACPQDISYPTDIDLLNESRQKADELIDKLCDKLHIEKRPRTYRNKARKQYLQIAQKKTKKSKEIRIGIKRQLQYLNRNINHINKLLDTIKIIPFNKAEYKYFLVLQTLYAQQRTMYDNKTHSIEHRIVSIHQPHIRPIVRGKAKTNVEFGSKIQLSLMNGYAFLSEFNWEPYNEGQKLELAIDQYKSIYGVYPQEVLADKIYCNRNNRAMLKERGINLKAKPLGRKPAVPIHLSPGERNPIEGKFGQAKTRYGLNNIRARLSVTSESWIATIILVLNLVKLAREAPYFLFRNWLNKIIVSLENAIGKFPTSYVPLNQKYLCA